MTPHGEYVILDFETTGLSADFSRIIEVGAVIVKDLKVLDQFHSLMNPGFSIPYYITAYTGITNEMVQNEPNPEALMPDLKEFIGERPLIAHNASFDKKFLIAEMDRASLQVENSFLCTLLLARRLIVDSPNYQLGTLVDHLSISRNSLQAHRALDDVLMTAEVWFHIYRVIQEKTGIERPDFDLFSDIMSIPKKKMNNYLDQCATNKTFF